MEKLNHRERVMAALSGHEPDRVPYCELAIDRVFAANPFMLIPLLMKKAAHSLELVRSKPKTILL